MLYNIIDDCIESELLHGFNLDKKEIKKYFKKLESDNRFKVLKGCYYFYKEKSIKDILKDYPELDEVIKDHDSLNTYIEDKYQEEDIEIGSDKASINIDSNDLIELIQGFLEEFNDDELLNNLETIIIDSERSAKFSLFNTAFRFLFSDVKRYVENENNNAYIDWDVIKRNIPIKEGE